MVMMIVARIILIFLIIHNVNAEFWTTTTIESINFHGSCITATNCIINKSKFMLNLTLPELAEGRIIEFPLIQLNERLSFINHFEVGNPDTSEIGLSIVMPIGTKPLRQLHFCDEAIDVQLVEQRYEPKVTYSNYLLRGRCFNTTITIEKRNGPVCPPCLQSESAELKSSTLNERLNDPYFIIPVIISFVLLFITIMVICYYTCCVKEDYYVSKSPGCNNVVKPLYLNNHVSPATTSSYVNSRFIRNQLIKQQLPEAPRSIASGTSGCTSNSASTSHDYKRVQLHSGISDLQQINNHQYEQIEIATSEVLQNYEYETPKSKKTFEKDVKMIVKAASEIVTPAPSISSDEGVMMA